MFCFIQRIEEHTKRKLTIIVVIEIKLVIKTCQKLISKIVKKIKLLEVNQNFFCSTEIFDSKHSRNISIGLSPYFNVKN